MSGVSSDTNDIKEKAIQDTQPKLDTPAVFLKSPAKVQEIRRVKIEFTADESMAQKIERAKELLRHKYPKAKLEDIFNEALELLLEIIL